MGKTTHSKLALICLISSTVPAATALSTAVTAAQALGLLSRDSSTCSNPSDVQCSGFDFPSNFCCPSSTKCVPLNNATSVICCPEGQSCQIIAPINCDITQQNATTHPLNPVKNTDLTGKLVSCGGDCCPQGFICQNNQCVMDSKTSSPTSSSTPAPTSVPSLTTGSSKPTTTSEAHCDAFPVGAVLVGFFPGMVLGALLAILIGMCIKRRNNRRKSGDFGHVSATVSDPIYQPNGAYRTDFLRREPPVTPERRKSKVRSLFQRSPRPDGIGRTIPQIKKEPSTESISVFASPPQLRPDTKMTRKTTFSDMMENAGFPKNAPYVIVEGQKVRDV
ncbi:MAG: hypothetical protein M1812_000638 [Candelaria pacifica]|nr:MAG: hypothetical protein M1812_000638 [Candelaria pacifica]